MADEAEVESFGPPEPVAPWNWSSIPDYGPVQQFQHVAAFLLIGVSMTLVYEYTTYFDQVSREFAYPLIWLAIFFRLLAHLSPRELSEEDEIAAREKAEQIAFKKRLAALASEDDENDDETAPTTADDALHAKKQQ
ncbi:hypothetical protein SPRG_07723 [Saprolegnia parasitica CBS 223.65]|uniref:Uncharacterized protein n=1 Tax=Saprolegnia parasitica (strain CBS 223.65) TaxID=695850 RepID=A0A067CKC5_SAPPC|nr:hypothetical protein SPRG_07723 [Saprolegnia parasitica CBS 223.65]KDO27011.1 hypothetical protein SPRG_07723 [Saprolegnia parasitica CBS 223.65]|eukprot:XP_012202388.1 hypothetical protein SPRG_07723 [Saprolegnia parasitica CBS 223.65]